MKNTINLYLDSFKPKPDMPALQHIGLACLLVVSMLLVWHKLIVDQVTEAIERTSVLQQQLSSLEKERQQAQKRLEALPSGGLCSKGWSGLTRHVNSNRICCA